jgi:transposase
VASYIAMIPCEHTSGKRQRLGKLTKQGNSLLCYLWTEAGMHADGKTRSCNASIGASFIQKGMGRARIAAARKLGIRLWIKRNALARTVLLKTMKANSFLSVLRVSSQLEFIGDIFAAVDV